MRNNHTFITVLITFALTSLLWAAVYRIMEVKRTVEYEKNQLKEEKVDCEVVEVTDEEATADMANQQTTVSSDLAADIIGKWVPVETAESTLVFSPYGTLNVKNNYDIEYGYVYKLSGDVVKYGMDSDWLPDSFKVKITINDAGTMYLEIYNDRELGGKYMKKSK